MAQLSLAETLARIKMEVDEGVDVTSPELNERFKEVLSQVKELPSDRIVQILSEQLDSEMYPGWTAIMFACSLLKSSWINSILKLAKQVEEEELHVRKNMLALRNYSRETALMILIEAEHVRAEEGMEEEAEERDVELNLKHIQKLVDNGANPNDAHGGPSAKTYALELGVSNIWDNLKHSKPKTKKGNKKARGGTLRK